MTVDPRPRVGRGRPAQVLRALRPRDGARRRRQREQRGLLGRPRRRDRPTARRPAARVGGRRRCERRRGRGRPLSPPSPPPAAGGGGAGGGANRGEPPAVAPRRGAQALQPAPAGHQGHLRPQLPRGGQAAAAAAAAAPPPLRRRRAGEHGGPADVQGHPRGGPGGVHGGVPAHGEELPQVPDGHARGAEPRGGGPRAGLHRQLDPLPGRVWV